MELALTVAAEVVLAGVAVYQREVSIRSLRLVPSMTAGRVVQLAFSYIGRKGSVACSASVSPPCLDSSGSGISAAGGRSSALPSRALPVLYDLSLVAGIALRAGRRA